MPDTIDKNKRDWWMDRIDELEAEMDTLDPNDPKWSELKKEAMNLWVRHEEPTFYE